MAPYRHLSADAVIPVDGEVVLLLRDKEPSEGKWVLPGGMVETGETAREASEREAREETGLRVEATEFVGLFDSPDQDRRGNVSAAYLWRPEEEQEPRPVEEASRAETFPPGDLPGEMGFDHREILRSADL